MFRIGPPDTLIHVTANGELNEAMAEEAETMLRDGRIEGLVCQLQAAYPWLAHEAEAAVGHGVAALIRIKQSPTRPFSYLTSCAYNEMKRIGKFRAREASLEGLRDDSDWEPAYDEWSTEERALMNDTYKELAAHVATWENNNARIVTQAYLEAIHLGEPPTAGDVAEELSAVTGNEVTDDEVRTWKSRGFRRLRTYVNDQRTLEEEGQR